MEIKVTTNHSPNQASYRAPTNRLLPTAEFRVYRDRARAELGGGAPLCNPSGVRDNDEMVRRRSAQSAEAEDGLEKIRQLQQRIFDREEQIADLVQSAEPPPKLISVIESKDADPRLQHLARLIIDWDMLVARSRAVTDDDIDLIGALVRLVGDLLLIQPDGIDERWITKLEEYLADQRAKVS